MGIGKDGQQTSNYTPGYELLAKQTIFAEGCRGSLTGDLFEKFGLRKNAQPQTYGIGIKEIWEIEPAKHKPGKLIHSVGWPLDAAINAWCAEQELTAKPPRPGGRRGEQWTTSALLEMTPAGRCVQCGSIDAAVREELPLPTPVCDTCWEELAEELRHEVTYTPTDQQVTLDQRGEAS
jgi:hypothetical protein